MSDPQLREAHASSPQPGEPLPARSGTRRRVRPGGIFGVAEIVGLAVSGLLLMAAGLAYLFWLTPAHSRLESLQRERGQLQKRLVSSQGEFQHNTDTQTAVAKLSESLDNFENNQLAGRNEGRMALYRELNESIKRNGVRNSAGPFYAPLDELKATTVAEGAASSTQQDARVTKSGNARWQTIFPGIAVSVTVEGQYQNLRRLIRDIEASHQFLIINAVDLESVTDTNRPRTSATGPAVPGGRAANDVVTPTPRATLVSLRLDMSAYFQRIPNNATLSPASATH